MVSSSEQIPNTEHRPVESGEFQRSLDQINTRFDDVNRRFDDVNMRFDDVNTRFDDVNRRFDNVNARFDDVNNRFDDLRSDTNEKINLLHSQMTSGQAWTRWGFGLIVALLITLMGLILSGVG